MFLYVQKSKQERLAVQTNPVHLQRYTYRVLQTIQIKFILLCVWAEPAVLVSTTTTLELKYEIQIG